MKPAHTFHKSLSDPLPASNVHLFSTPPMMEALNLLPLAYRVGSHIANEKKQGRGTIFDLNGMTLQPPHPGPFGGCPIGGMGSGSVGRGFRGDFRRWSLAPGKYIHKVIDADQFSIRAKIGNEIYSAVLSAFDCDKGNGIASWGWNKIGWSAISYESTFPRAWTTFHEAVPNVRVTIRQVSPFLPHSYSETSFPAGVFHVEVENHSGEDAEVSVMFTFQNGFTSAEEDLKRKVHAQFHKSYLGNALGDSGLSFPTGQADVLPKAASGPEVAADIPDLDIQIVGVCMTSQDVLQNDRSSRGILPRSRSSRNSTPRHSEASTSCPITIDCFPGLDTSRCSSSYSDEDYKLTANSPTFAIAACCRRVETIHRQEAISGSGLPEDDSPNLLNAGDGVLSSCACFLVNSYHKNWLGQTTTTTTSSAQAPASSTSFSKCLLSGEPINGSDLWQRFHLTGDLFINHDSPFGTNSLSSPNLHCVANEFSDVGSAVCLRKSIPSRSSAVFSFSLAWDIPQTQFGVDSPSVPKYYTRFFGRNRLSAHSLAALALLRANNWESRIHEWQESVLKANEKVNHEVNLHVPKTRQLRSPSAPGGPFEAGSRSISLSVSGTEETAIDSGVDSSAGFAQASDSEMGAQDQGHVEGPDSVSIPDSYKHMIFNELYFLVDGGTFWTDTSDGVPNDVIIDAIAVDSVTIDGLGGAEQTEPEDPMTTSFNDSIVSRDSIGGTSDGSMLYSYMNHKSKGLSVAYLKRLIEKCTSHDKKLQDGEGDQKDVGQFLYLGTKLLSIFVCVGFLAVRYLY
jgi:hypothetical protein